MKEVFVNIHEIVKEMSVMTFGRYKDKSYQELIDEDPEYVLWLIEREVLKGVYADLLEYEVLKKYGDWDTFRDCVYGDKFTDMIDDVSFDWYD